MPRPHLPNLQRERTRHGRIVWYVRLDRGARVRLHADFGTPQFAEQYRAALAGDVPAINGVPGKPKASPGTMAWLVERYRETSAWKDLSLATRRQRENIFANVLQSVGDKPYNSVRKAHMTAGRDRRRDTPSAARNFLDTVRGLFRWAVDAGHLTVDPTTGVTNPKRPRNGGFPVWTEDDVAAYEARWPIGTKERVWLAVLLYSGLRRGDAARLGKQHVRGGIASLHTEKTRTPVTIPLLPVLVAVLKAGPVGTETFICGERGASLTKESFGNLFRKACRTAGVDKSAHGLRKIGATRAAENGATVAELEAIFGWSGGGMASLYTRAANRARLSKNAIGKLIANPISIPLPSVNGAGADENNPDTSST